MNFLFNIIQNSEEWTW